MIAFTRKYSEPISSKIQKTPNEIPSEIELLPVLRLVVAVESSSSVCSTLTDILCDLEKYFMQHIPTLAV